MNSSTSNSKLRLLVISMLASCASIVGAYHILIITNVIPAGRPTQYGGDRIERTSRYATQGSYSVVFLGSSLLGAVSVRPLPSGWYNLCVGGGSAIEGCDVILTSRIYPKVVAVEAGERLTASLKKSFVQTALSPWTVGLRRLSPIFDLRYQPASVLLTQMDIKMGWRPNAQVVEQYKSDFILRRQRNLPTAVEVKQLRLQAIKLRQKLREIKAHGVKVVLVDVPQDKDIQNSKFARAIRTRLKEELPEKEFNWYEPEPEKWETFDGSHLTDESATRFSILLEQQMKNLQIEDEVQ